MRLPLLRQLGAVAVCALLGACASDATGPDDERSIAGRWVGETSTGRWVLTLDEDETGSLSGGGSFNSSSIAVSLTVTSGIHVDRDFSITLESTGFSDINYSGSVDATGDRLTGTLNGSGFSDDELTLERP